MRLLPWLVLAMSLALASTAEARLFWQHYGSIIPSEDGCGCTWNWNQDYFVPRHPSSCRYGLFSPCKTTCTTSPAAKWCHPYYPGYCSMYGPCRYCWRNHVYGRKCGCSPVAACLKRNRSNKDCACGGPACCGAGVGCYRNHSHVWCVGGGCGGAKCCDAGGCCPSGACCTGGACCAGGCGDGLCYEPVAPLYNVEPSKFEMLGSIPVEGGDLLGQTDLLGVGNEGGQLLLQPRGPLQQLQELSLPNLPQLNQPAPRP